ncbi:MAG: CoA-binding protein [Chloroflexota bacterium]|nr:MAG: CoA-binding protein [Chloroflexota bacterium]
MSKSLLNELRPLFYPESVAIVGVSAMGDGAGNRFLQILKKFGYGGRIYLVHPTATEIEGLKAYPSVRDIPGRVDFVNISAPAPHVPQIIADCVAKGVPAAEIFTAGFRELSEEGRKLELEIKKIAGGNIRIVGPNCFGVYSPGGGLTLLPGANYPRESGNVGVIYQSGGWVTDFIWRADAFNMKFSQVVSYGNGIDLNEVSLLEYFAEDPNTTIVAAYLEGINDGNRFRKIVSSLRGAKPVIIWKGGLSESGKRAVNSHTGSLAGDRSVWNAFFKQTGAVQVRGFEELLDTTAIFNYLTPGNYRNLAFIGGGGGVGVAASDISEGFNFKIPQSTTEITNEVSKLIPPQGTSIKNPFDTGSPNTPAQVLERLMQIVAGWTEVDALIINRMFFYGLRELMGEHLAEEDARVAAVMRAKQRIDKPLLVVLEELAYGSDKIDMERDRRSVRNALLKAGIYVTPNVYRALRALNNYSEYWKGAGMKRKAS